MEWIYQNNINNTDTDNILKAYVVSFLKQDRKNNLGLVVNGRKNVDWKR